MSIWDNPDLKVGGDFVKFENIGDTITGRVVTIRAHRFDDGTVAPQVFLTTPEGDEKTITAGQVRLKAALAEQRPEAGDTLTVTLSNIEKRSGGKTLKHFDVAVTRGTGTAPATTTPTAASAAAPAATAAPPAQPDPAALQAALGQLTPEQRQALGISA